MAMVKDVRMKCLKIHNATRILFMLFIPVLFMQSCIVLPVHTGDTIPGKGRGFTSEELSFIRPGITTKGEVVEQLANPDVIWVEERIFAYTWWTRWGILYSGGVTPYGASASADDIGVKHNVLLIRFDPNDRVERFEVTHPSRFDSYGEHLEKWHNQIKNPPGTEATE